jgi:hypothetical protein
MPGAVSRRSQGTETETETISASLFRHLLPGGILLAVGIGPLYVMEALKSLFGLGDGWARYALDDPYNYSNFVLGLLSPHSRSRDFSGRPKQSKTDSP